MNKLIHPHRSRRTFGPLLAAFAAAMPMTAQQVAHAAATGSTIVAGAEAGESLVPIHTAAADVGVPYGVWAAGSRYKASFHDGATRLNLPIVR